MRSRKVFKILLQLQEGQRKRFGAYLASPYLNSNGRLLRFWEILDGELLGGEKDLQPEEIWEMGLSQGPYHKNGFDKICAELLAALNAFLGMETYLEQKEFVAAHQLEAYVDGGLDEWTPGLFKSLKGKFEQDFNRSPDGMYAWMRLVRNYSVHLFRQPRAPRGEWLLDIDGALTDFFLAQKLELAAALSNYNQVFKSGLELSDEAWMVDRLEASFEDFPPFIRLQYLGYLTANGSEEHFHRLKKELGEQRESIAQDEGRHLYRLALNFCYFRMNEGDEAYEAEADALLLELLGTGWLLKDGLLPPEQFKNIVSIRLRQGAVDWVREFVGAWEGKLTDEQEGAAALYNRSVLAFFEGRFGECIRGMDEVMRDFKADVYYGLDARLLQIKALYERNAPDDFLELESRLNSFRVFVLRNKKVGEIDQGHYKNFVKQCRRLVRLRDEVGEKRGAKIKKFLSDLSGLRPVSNRRWFEEMADRMERR